MPCLRAIRAASTSVANPEVSMYETPDRSTDKFAGFARKAFDQRCAHLARVFDGDPAMNRDAVTGSGTSTDGIVIARHVGTFRLLRRESGRPKTQLAPPLAHCPSERRVRES